MLAGDVEGVEEFLKSHSNYGPLFCAWERIKKELAVVQKPIAQQANTAICHVSAMQCVRARVIVECQTPDETCQHRVKQQ